MDFVRRDHGGRSDFRDLDHRDRSDFRRRRREVFIFPRIF
jgi:hypothetical protein